MTLLEFHEKYAESAIKVVSGYNGKVLCQKFNPKRHQGLQEREIQKICSEIMVRGSGFGNIAFPILCVYVNGHEEYVKEHSHECNE